MFHQLAFAAGKAAAVIVKGADSTLTGTLVLADLARAVVTGQALKATLQLRSGLGKKAPPGGLTLNFPDDEPVGAGVGLGEEPTCGWSDGQALA